MHELVVIMGGPSEDMGRGSICELGIVYVRTETGSEDGAEAAMWYYAVSSLWLSRELRAGRPGMF